MQFAGEIEIAADRQTCWEIITDPWQVAACLPGDPTVEEIDSRNFRVTVAIGNALLRTNVTAEVELTELDEPRQVTGVATAAVMAISAMTEETVRRLQSLHEELLQ